LAIVEHILFENEDLCLCRLDDEQVILFSKKNGEVLSDNYSSWIATNNWAKIEADNERVKRENA
jgi:hypothetical protein